ncbi:MAG: hypothetical protein ACI9FD_003313 [Gammaproteobacteria bacterium]|jgi:hypothetical protein
MKFQYGALIGLEKPLGDGTRTCEKPITDIDNLLSLSMQLIDNEKAFPYDILVREVAKYRPRNR